MNTLKKYFRYVCLPLIAGSIIMLGASALVAQTALCPPAQTQDGRYVAFDEANGTLYLLNSFGITDGTIILSAAQITQLKSDWPQSMIAGGYFPGVAIQSPSTYSVLQSSYRGRGIHYQESVSPLYAEYGHYFDTRLMMTPSETLRDTTINSAVFLYAREATITNVVVTSAGTLTVIGNSVHITDEFHAVGDSELHIKAE